MKFERKHIIIGLFILALAAGIYLFTRKRKDESSFAEVSGSNPSALAVQQDLPLWYNIKYDIQSKGKSGVFPMVLTKVTDDVIELPFKLSLQRQDYPYKFIDVSTGDKITIVDAIDMSYNSEGKSFLDNFLVTDKGYVIAYSQASKHFGITKI